MKIEHPALSFKTRHNYVVNRYVNPTFTRPAPSHSSNKMFSQ